MHVANVILEGHFGGPQHRIAQVAARLAADGVDTTVVMPRRGSARFAEELRAAGVAHRRLPLHNLSRHPAAAALWALTFLPELVVLTVVLRRLRPAIVHCNGAWQPKAVLAGRLAGCRVVLHLNDTRPSRAVLAMFRLLAPLCHGFVVAAERVRELYLAGRPLGGRPVCLIPAPVDTARFDPAAVSPAPRPSGRLRVVTVGNVNPDKGLEHLAAAARIVAAERADVDFLVYGKVTERQRAYATSVRELAPGPQFELVGTTDDVPGALAAADVYVCSSNAEASPLSVWEAMAMELAVVATDVGDVARLVPDGEAGFVVPVGDPAAIADRVLRLAADPGLRARLGARARDIAVAQLDLARCVAAHRACYEAIAAG